MFLSISLILPQTLAAPPLDPITFIDLRLLRTASQLPASAFSGSSPNQPFLTAIIPFAIRFSSIFIMSNGLSARIAGKSPYLSLGQLVLLNSSKNILKCFLFSESLVLIVAAEVSLCLVPNGLFTCCAFSATIEWQKESKVIARTSLEFLMSSSSPVALSSSLILLSISIAALSVNVSRRMFCGRMPFLSIDTYLATTVVVLPVPGPASTMWIPSISSTSFF